MSQWLMEVPRLEKCILTFNKWLQIQEGEEKEAKREVGKKGRRK